MRDGWWKQSEWKWSEEANDGVAAQPYFIVSINFSLFIGLDQMK